MPLEIPSTAEHSIVASVYLMITAATSILPFVGTDGSPKSDVSEFAKVFDWIAIMNYDVWGVRLTSSLKTSISLMPFVFHLVLVQQRWP